jgi:ketosteroid isomerase-like protein
LSRENLEAVRVGYEAFNRGDVDWMVERMHPEIEWHEAPEVPGAKVYRGKEEVRGYLESFGRVWDDIRFDPEGEFQAAGDKVLAFVHLSGKGKGSGASVDAHLAHLFTLRDAKGVRVDIYFDREQALAALKD